MSNEDQNHEPPITEDDLRTLDTYQGLAMSTAKFGPVDKAVALDYLRIFSEIGSLSEIVKKIFRDKNGEFSKDDLDSIEEGANEVARQLYCITDLDHIEDKIEPDRGIYPVFGLVGESGEIAGKVYVYKCQGKDLSSLPDEDKEELVKEIGDVLWYLAALCQLIGVSFAKVAIANLRKLFSRRARNKIGGSGDNR